MAFDNKAVASSSRKSERNLKGFARIVIEGDFNPTVRHLFIMVQVDVPVGDEAI